jgi:NAD(P)H-dependent FMN reductase
MRVLAISGSLRNGSYNTTLLRVAAEAAPAGVQVELFDALATLPPYDEDADGDTPPAGVAALREAVAGAGALLIATPEYNGSLPGQLKHAIDWCSRPYRESAIWGKPAATLSASTGSFGGVWAQDELRRVLGLAGARVVDAPRVAVPSADREPLERLAPRLRAVLETLAGAAGAVCDTVAA